MGIFDKFFRNTPSASNFKLEKHQTDYKHFEALKENGHERIAVIPWNSPEGRALMVKSIYHNSFFFLAHNYQTQINPFYSSVASMVTVLNSLRLEKGVLPEVNEKSFRLFDRATGELKEYEYNLYTQENLLNDETDLMVKKRENILPKIKDDIGYVDFAKFNPGLSLIEVMEILQIYKCKTEIHYAHDNFEMGVNNFITHLKECTLSNNKFIIANFYGAVFGLPQSGHFSTIGAYNGMKKAKALILDTAAYKTPWYWVEIEDLYRAMNTTAYGGAKRGYIIVEDSF
ncbi:MAG TPA: hypothetical protein DIV86_00845 [Alphaproteobacteria bacterium]|nr:hypothetical protein [Alphaproteobacteria bacterium]